MAKIFISINMKIGLNLFRFLNSSNKLDTQLIIVNDNKWKNWHSSKDLLIHLWQGPCLNWLDFWDSVCVCDGIHPIWVKPAPHVDAWSFSEICAQRWFSHSYKSFQFSFPSRLVGIPRLKSPVFPTISPIAGGRIVGCIHFLRELEQNEMQTVPSRIWTWVTISISYIIPWAPLIFIQKQTSYFINFRNDNKIICLYTSVSIQGIYPTLHSVRINVGVSCRKHGFWGLGAKIIYVSSTFFFKGASTSTTWKSTQPLSLLSEGKGAA